MTCTEKMYKDLMFAFDTLPFSLGNLIASENIYLILYFMIYGLCYPMVSQNLSIVSIHFGKESTWPQSVLPLEGEEQKNNNCEK